MMIDYEPVNQIIEWMGGLSSFPVEPKIEPFILRVLSPMLVMDQWLEWLTVMHLQTDGPVVELTQLGIIDQAMMAIRNDDDLSDDVKLTITHGVLENLHEYLVDWLDIRTFECLKTKDKEEREWQQNLVTTQAFRVKLMIDQWIRLVMDECMVAHTSAVPSEDTGTNDPPEILTELGMKANYGEWLMYHGCLDAFEGCRYAKHLLAMNHMRWITAAKLRRYTCKTSRPLECPFLKQ